MNPTYTKEQILHALHAGGADGVRALLNKKIVPITEDLIKKASNVCSPYPTVSGCLSLWYLNPNACDLDNGIIDLRGEISTNRPNTNWRHICRWEKNAYLVGSSEIYRTYES